MASQDIYKGIFLTAQKLAFFSYSLFKQLLITDEKWQLLSPLFHTSNFDDTKYLQKKTGCSFMYKMFKNDSID